MDYRPTLIESNESPWSDLLAVLLLVIFVLLFPITWPMGHIQRLYALKRRGFWARRLGRDPIEYQELHDGSMRRLLIAGEMIIGGPHVVYVPSITDWDQSVPEWARGRRDEIIEKVKRDLGTRSYEYVLSSNDAEQAL